MYLNEAVFDNFESFQKRVDYVLMNTDEKDFSSGYVPDYRLYLDTLGEDAPGYDYLAYAAYLEELAAKCLCNYNFYKRIIYYKDSSIRPHHIYDLAYYSYFLYRSDAVYEPLEKIIYEIIKGVSFNRIPDEDLTSNETIMSEWAIADILFSIDARMACAIISKSPIDPVQTAELKKYIIRKDSEGFIAYIIENTINTFHVQIACALIILGDRIKQELTIKNSSDEIVEQSINDILENPEIELSTGYYNFYNTLLHNPEKLSILDIVGFTYTSELLRVQIVKHLKYYSTNIEAVNEFEKILQEHPELDTLSLDDEDIKQGLIYQIKFPILEDFKRRFVNETSYPPSVGKAKEPKSCYRYNEDKCEWKEDAILYLYHRLVNHGFIEWSEETLYSFMYRMCPEYKPERADPSPIVWNGDISTLWTLIYYFHGESIKMDNLTRLFFRKQNGSTFSKNDGGKNSTHSKDKQIMEILQDPMFAKS